MPSFRLTLLEVWVVVDGFSNDDLSIVLAIIDWHIYWINYFVSIEKRIKE